LSNGLEFITLPFFYYFVIGSWGKQSGLGWST